MRRNNHFIVINYNTIVMCLFGAFATNCIHIRTWCVNVDVYQPGLDLIGLAHGYGLPHLPKMPELKDKDFSRFTPHSTPPSDIPYMDKAREKKRQLLLQQLPCE